MAQFTDRSCHLIAQTVMAYQRQTRSYVPGQRRRSPLISTGGAASSGSGVFPCKVIDKDGLFYNVTKYENGIDSASTGTAKVFILQLALADTLPADTWIMASLSSIGITGGGNVP